MTDAELLTRLMDETLAGYDSDDHEGCNFYCCPSCHTDMRSEAHLAAGACE